MPLVFKTTGTSKYACALEKEIGAKHSEYTLLARNGGRYAEAIVVIKRVLKAARWTLRPTLVLLAASAELSAEETRKEGLSKYFWFLTSNCG